MDRAGGGLAQVAEKLGERICCFDQLCRSITLRLRSKLFFYLRSVHPLQEVRRRSLQSLDFKIRQGLVTQDDFLQVSGKSTVLQHCL